SMDAYSFLKGVLFLLLAVIGIPCNFAILGAFGKMIYLGKNLFPVEGIICLLALVNTMMILTRGVPHILFVFEIRRLYSQHGCAVIIYMARVSRAMAICLTCLLSCSQFLSITPPPSKWISLKAILSKTKNLALIVVCLLFLNLGLCVCSVLYAMPETNSTNLNFTYNLGYCIVKFPNRHAYLGFGLSLLARDLTFVTSMVIASIAIVMTLLRHRQQVSSIRRSSQSHEATVETQAAKSVVTLVTLYVLFFGIENTIFLYTMTGHQVNSVLSDVRFFFSTCYASVFPIVAIVASSKIREQLKCFTQSKE
uniref:Vomeronasal type-1 receptor n=1 Tax=Latimeria chalumnae TaxID=7897 RepID=H3B062_LATCH